MSPLEIWGLGGPPRSTGTTCFNQSAQNNLVGGSTLDIDVFGFEPSK
jgi:hypothetical protein